MDKQEKKKFLTDAFKWAEESGQDIKSETFVSWLFQKISPMSNFEIGHEDIEAYRDLNY